MSTDAIAHRLAIHKPRPTSAQAWPQTRHHAHPAAHRLDAVPARRHRHQRDRALWLGHEQIATTGIYLHADLSIKQQALDGTRPPEGSAGRYQADDTLPAWLSSVLRQGSCRISGFESDHTEGSG